MSNSTIKFLSFFILSLLLAVECVYAHAPKTVCSKSFSFHIDKKNRARVTLHGIPIIVSVGNFFEFYNRNFDGSRNRIVSGPWHGLLNGKLKKKKDGIFILSGVSKDGNITFSTIYEFISSNILDLEIKFYSKKQTGSFSYEIAKLNPVFFKNCKVKSQPSSTTDIFTLPENAKSFKNRILLKKKKILKLYAKGFELEIQDIKGANPITVADFRNAPWDRYASFYLSGGINLVEQGKNYSVKYRIRLTETNNKSTKINRPKAVSRTLNLSKEMNENDFFAIPCKKKILDEQHFFSGPFVVLTDQDGPEVKILCEKLSEITGEKILRRPIKNRVSPAAKGIILTNFKEGFSLGPQSFKIIVAPQRILIQGNDGSGRIFAVYKLLSLFTKKKDKLRICCGEYQDWPDIKTRGMMIELLPPARKDIDIFKRYIDALSMARVNLIVFWHRPQDLLEWENKNNNWSKKQIEEIASYARQHYMDVWGGMVSKFNPELFPELNIAKGSNFYNPFQEKSFKRICSLFAHIIECYKPSGILIGHDEITGLNIYSKKDGIPTNLILSNSVNKIHDWLAFKGIKTIVAGDMLLDINRWKSVAGGGVNSGNPLYNSGDTYKAGNTITKEVAIFDWHYRKAGDYKTLKYFSDNGFPVFGASWHDPEASCAMAESVKKYKANGIIGTDYGFWRTLSPAATTLYTPVCAWGKRKPFTGMDDDLMALRNILKGASVSKKTFHQSPFPLTSYANEYMTDNRPGDGEGFFDLGSYADLRNFPTGEKEFCGIKFDILQDKGFSGKNCIVVGFDGNGKSDPADNIKINVNGRRCRGLAFLHTCCLDNPDYKHRKLGQYRVKYQNGKEESIDIVQNWNITDLRSSPLVRRNNWSFKRRPENIIGSDLAWQGISGMKEPLNVQQFIWINPHPDYLVDQILIEASKTGEKSKLALIGLTYLD